MDKKLTINTALAKCDEFIFLEYTGLKDKNKKEIYEGDIVQFQHIDDYGYMTNIFSMESDIVIEIIGNIYENPELLKENK